MSGKAAERSTALKSMPAILYGTAWKDTRTADLVFTAFLQGFRGVDTAAQRKHYREDLVGKGVHQACAQLGLARGDVWIQTKFTPVSGQDTTGYVPYDVHAPVAEQVCASFQASLANLHPEQPIPSVTELVAKYAVTARGNRNKAPTPPPAHQVYIDSYLLHSPMTTLQSTLEAWRVLEALVDTGLVRQIGVSNVYDPQIFQTLFQLARIKPSIVQNRWHSSTGHDVSLLPLFSPQMSPNTFPPPAYTDVEAPHGVTYQPFWTLSGNQRLLDSDTVAVLAIKHSLTPAQVVYAFVHQGLGIPGLRTCVLSGTKNEAHMEEAVQAVSLDAWEEDDLTALRAEVYGE
ncbi:hypothetical protein MBRA1_002347 [Malassezia brasiliensis]|uniref:NADP-dependent oxidoreductase domain-containing protein n=1 Tax=Malassezia brasiliensis TaxID=1821822 RepID=A0AAF0DX69_9BASI|nr:hypothetical protein MBRA1_002347 [Malassezia brasiliensis]